MVNLLPQDILETSEIAAMKINSVLMTAFGAGSLALLSSAMNPANAASTSFSVNDFTNNGSTTEGLFTLEDNGNGGVQFTLDAGSYQAADIRGIWFNIDDASLLSGLNISGANITDQAIGDNSVTTVGGNSNNLNGGGGQANPFDIGLSIGNNGLRGGRDDFQVTTFTVSHNAIALSIDNFIGQQFGARFTSVENKDGARNGSSKLLGMAPTGNKPPSVPEPLPGGMATTMSLLAIGGAFKVMSNKKRA